MSALILSLRPKQWTKNLVLFAGLLFSKNLFEPHLFQKSLFAFFLFCLLSSSVYLLNDLMDLESDKRHPQKSTRPIASGRLNPKKALAFAISFSSVGILLSFLLDQTFGISSLLFFLLMSLYSSLLKKIVILDVLAISIGFVIRAIAGALVIHVEISSWLLVCTTLLALFLALSKRRYELVQWSEEFRKSLVEYSPHLLDQMISVVASALVMAYALYTMSQETIEKFHTHGLAFTVPFVLYGIFRYLYLIYRKEEGGNPETTLLQDKPLLINCGLWIIAVGIILYLLA